MLSQIPVQEKRQKKNQENITKDVSDVILNRCDSKGKVYKKMSFYSVFVSRNGSQLVHDAHLH